MNTEWTRGPRRLMDQSKTVHILWVPEKREGKDYMEHLKKNGTPQICMKSINIHI